MEVGAIIEGVPQIAVVPLSPGEQIVSIEEEQVITKLENLKEDKIRNQRFSTKFGGIVGPKVC